MKVPVVRSPVQAPEPGVVKPHSNGISHPLTSTAHTDKQPVGAGGLKNGAVLKDPPAPPGSREGCYTSCSPTMTEVGGPADLERSSDVFEGWSRCPEGFEASTLPKDEAARAKAAALPHVHSAPHGNLKTPPEDRMPPESGSARYNHSLSGPEERLGDHPSTGRVVPVAPCRMNSFCQSIAVMTDIQPLDEDQQRQQCPCSGRNGSKMPFGLCLLLMAMYSLITGPWFFNWTPMNDFLLREGAYAWLCDSNAEGSGRSNTDEAATFGLCLQQEKAISYLFTVASTATFCCSIFGGLLLDHLGSLGSALTGWFVMALGWGLLAFSGEHFDAYPVAFGCLGSSIDAAFLPLIIETRRSERNSSFAIAILGAGRSAGFVVPLGLDAVSRATGWRLRTLSMGYGVGLCACCALAATLFMPRDVPIMRQFVDTDSEDCGSATPQREERTSGHAHRASSGIVRGPQGRLLGVDRESSLQGMSASRHVREEQRVDPQALDWCECELGSLEFKETQRPGRQKRPHVEPLRSGESPRAADRSGVSQQDEIDAGTNQFHSVAVTIGNADSGCAPCTTDAPVQRLDAPESQQSAAGQSPVAAVGNNSATAGRPGWSSGPEPMCGRPHWRSRLMRFARNLCSEVMDPRFFLVVLVAFNNTLNSTYFLPSAGHLLPDVYKFNQIVHCLPFMIAPMWGLLSDIVGIIPVMWLCNLAALTAHTLALNRLGVGVQRLASLLSCLRLAFTGSQIYCYANKTFSRRNTGTLIGVTWAIAGVGPVSAGAMRRHAIQEGDFLRMTAVTVCLGAVNVILIAALFALYCRQPVTQYRVREIEKEVARGGLPPDQTNWVQRRWRRRHAPLQDSESQQKSAADSGCP